MIADNDGAGERRRGSTVKEEPGTLTFQHGFAVYKL